MTLSLHTCHVLPWYIATCLVFCCCTLSMHMQQPLLSWLRLTVSARHVCDTLMLLLSAGGGLIYGALYKP